MISNGWTFACDEARFFLLQSMTLADCAPQKQRLVQWKTPEMSMWAYLKFKLTEEFWLFVGQFAEARTYALREATDSADQLRAMVDSFRTLFVVATTMNATNAFDGRPDPEPVRFGDDVPAEDSDGDESS